MYDIILGKIIKKLSEDRIRLIMYIFNATLRLGYFRLQWITADITLILKPNKNP